MNLTLVTTLECRYTKWETTLSQMLYPEPDAWYKPNKYITTLVCRYTKWGKKLSQTLNWMLVTTLISTK